MMIKKPLKVLVVSQLWQTQSQETESRARRTAGLTVQPGTDRQCSVQSAAHSEAFTVCKLGQQMIKPLISWIAKAHRIASASCECG